MNVQHSIFLTTAFLTRRHCQNHSAPISRFGLDVEGTAKIGHPFPDAAKAKSFFLFFFLQSSGKRLNIQRDRPLKGDIYKINIKRLVKKQLKYNLLLVIQVTVNSR